MMLQGLVAGPRGQGERNMLGHICGQDVLPRKATSLVPSTQVRLLASSHHRVVLWHAREEQDLQLRPSGQWKANLALLLHFQLRIFSSLLG